MKNIRLLNNKFLFFLFSIIFLNWTNIFLAAKPKKDRVKRNSTKVMEDVEVTKCKKKIAECGETDEVKRNELRLELADIYFKLGQWQKSVNAYKEFIKFNPINLQDKCKDESYKKKLSDYEYATYRIPMSFYNDTLAPDRDQTATKDALTGCKEYLQQFVTTEFKDSLKNKSFSDLLKQVEKHELAVKQVASMAQRKLLDSEIEVFYFYLRNRSFVPAKRRLDYIKDKFFKETEDNEILKTLEDHFEKAQKKIKYKPLNEREISKLYVIYKFIDDYSPTQRRKRKELRTGMPVVLKSKRKNKDRF